MRKANENELEKIYRSAIRQRRIRDAYVVLSIVVILLAIATIAYLKLSGVYVVGTGCKLP